MNARLRRWSWAAAALAAALLAIALRPRPVRVEVTPLRRGPMRVTIDEEGRSQVKQRYDVAAPLSGHLLRLSLRPGDPVNQGDEVAHILPTDAPLLDPRARAEQQARIHAFEAAAAQSGASVVRARVAMATARDDLRRKEELARAGALAARDLELARGDAATRTQELAEAEFAARVVDHQLGEARAALERGRAGKLDDLAVLAPTAGQVLRVVHESEGVVSPGTALLEIGDPATIEIAADLLTVDAVKVRPGMPAFVDHWGGPAALAARVRRVEPSGFTKISALGVEEQRVRVLLDLVGDPSTWFTLRDGFRVEVHVVSWQRDSVLRAPASALFRTGDGWAAYVVEGGRIRERRLEVGEQSPEVAEIRGGLREDELLVLHPGESLHEGSRADPVLAR